jgi:hypothetical protein
VCHFITNTETKNKNYVSAELKNPGAAVDLIVLQILDCFNVPPRGKGSNRLFKQNVCRLSQECSHERKKEFGGSDLGHLCLPSVGSWDRECASLLFVVMMASQEMKFHHSSWRKACSASSCISRAAVWVFSPYCLKASRISLSSVPVLSFFFFWQACKRPCGEVSCPPSGIQLSVGA